MKKDKYFKFNTLNKDNDVIHLFTKKNFNFNKNNCSTEEINKNYKIIQKDLNYKFKHIISGEQLHSNKVVIIDKNNLYDNFKCDGFITNLKGVALVTYLADCQAIYLYDPIKKVIGNIHSGWKGTLNEIVKNAINLMIDKYNCEVKNILVFINPSIMECCFEVDTDVMLLFKNKFNNYKNIIFKNNNKYHINTIKINIDIMLELGINRKNIFCSNICTKCNNDKYHSYRNDGINSGRNIALICLK